MNIFQLRNAGEYGKVVANVLVEGRSRSPRDQATRDVGPTTIIIDDPRSGMPLGVSRNLDPAIGAVEALQLIAGVARPDVVLAVAPQFEAYANRDERGRLYFHGAYGERVGFQVMATIDKLKKDPNTRQAVITLWDPYRDNLPDAHDYPCTVALTFNTRDGELDMHTIMRSNDVWLGLPYDLFQFTQLQLTVATSLGLRLGRYNHHAISMHLYERDVNAASQFLTMNHSSTYGQRFQPHGLGRERETYQAIMHRARQILDGDAPSAMTRSEEWYWTTLREAMQRVQARLG